MSTMVGSPRVRSRKGTRWLLVTLVVTAVNLRAPISGVSALLDPIRHGLGLSGVGTSVLTTLPTACLAIFAFLGPALVRRFGEERLITACMAVLLAGDLVRSLATTAAVVTGTLAVSVAIGVVNGIVPGLIKRDFADRYVGVTALYTIVLTLGAAGASALAPRLGGPLHSSWQAPLAAVTIPVAVLGCAVWIPNLRLRAANGTRPRIPAALWRDPVAWQVTAFFGFTALSFFFVLGWLPPVCHDRGLSVATGGLILSVTALIQAAGSLGVPALVRRPGDQRVLAVAVALVNAAGLVALTVAPVRVGAWVAAVLLGLAQGAGFGLGLTLIGLRSRDVASATALSGMAQGVGYLIAVAGPLGAGLLHTATGGWTATLGLLLAVGLGQLASGLGAGRDRQVEA
jgi:CP family cyanate transporter-like MFS transporter